MICHYYKESGNYEVNLIGKEILLIPCNTHSNKKKVLVLNELSALIWRLLISEKLSVHEIAESICNIYDITKETLYSDINSLIDTLVLYEVIKFDN